MAMAMRMLAKANGGMCSSARWLLTCMIAKANCGTHTARMRHHAQPGYPAVSACRGDGRASANFNGTSGSSCHTEPGAACWYRIFEAKCAPLSPPGAHATGPEHLRLNESEAETE